MNAKLTMSALAVSVLFCARDVLATAVALALTVSVLVCVSAPEPSTPVVAAAASVLTCVSAADASCVCIALMFHGRADCVCAAGIHGWVTDYPTGTAITGPE